MLLLAQDLAQNLDLAGHVLRLGELQRYRLDVLEGQKSLLQAVYAVALIWIALANDHDIWHNAILSIAGDRADHLIVQGIPFPYTLLSLEIGEVVALILHCI